MTDALISLAAALEAIDERPPLVVSYTNTVTVEDVASTTLYWGGLPVMSEDEREAEEMLGIASACFINMGTENATSEERMVTAGRAASRDGLPVVFDPVGVGATSTRTAVAERLIEEVEISIIKGNYGEITALAGSDAEVRGVESVGEYTEIAETAIALARKTDAVVVASGGADIIADGSAAYELTAGDPMMGQFVGSGCLLGVTLATFAGAIGPEQPLATAVAGTLAFGVAGERAAAMDTWQGPASYKIALLDAIANVDASEVEAIDLDDRLDRVAEA